MTKDLAGRLMVDWQSGEAMLDLSERLRAAPAELRRDVLLHCLDDAEALLRDTDRAVDPHRPERRMQQQRLQNERRRALCERLAGQTILAAEPLVNGDVVLHLACGKYVVLYAHAEDVKLDVVPHVDHARQHAAAQGTGDYYLREHPSPADLPVEQGPVQLNG